jgi:hypothetical protein
MSEPRRAHPRYASPFECEVRRGGRLVGRDALDLSATGCRVRALAEVDLGARVTVSLRLPGSGARVEAEGEVARRIEGRRAGDAGRALGIRFRRVDPLSRRLLASVACWYPEARGGRGDARDPSGAAERGIRTALGAARARADSESREG